MKKNISKMINDAQKKNKNNMKQNKKPKFFSYKEDFVITEQEEREGGYFGNYNFKSVTT